MAYERPTSPLDYRVLEGFQPAPAPSISKKLRRQLARLLPGEAFWPAVWRSLNRLATGTREPIIQPRCDRQGQLFYVVYDPITRQRTVCGSEREVRIWLEERYYG